MGNVDIVYRISYIVYRISDIGGSTRLELDPFDMSAFYNISEIDFFDILGFYGIVTYFR